MDQQTIGVVFVFHEIAAGLNLPRLSAFFDRVAV